MLSKNVHVNLKWLALPLESIESIFNDISWILGEYIYFVWHFHPQYLGSVLNISSIYLLVIFTGKVLIIAIYIYNDNNVYRHRKNIQRN